MSPPRPTHEIKLYLPINNAELLISSQQALNNNPIESLLVSFTRARRFDLGSYCFKNRSGNTLIKNVSPSDFLAHRTEPIKKLARQMITSGLATHSLETCHAKLGFWAKLMRFAESQGMHDLLLSPQNYNKSLTAFIDSLTTTTLSLSYKQNIVSACIEIGEYLFAEENLQPSVVNPFLGIGAKQNQRKTESVAAPSDEVMAHYLRTCEGVFIGLLDFILPGKSFPYLATLGDEEVWLGVSQWMFASNKVLNLGKARFSGSMFYDYSTGAPRNSQNYAELSTSGKGYDYNKRMDKYQSELKAANTNLYHPKRFRLARLAHDCFLAIFAAASGMNESPLRKIPWSEEIEITSETHGMRSIKIRGFNRTVSFDVKPAFIKYLKMYCKLREYLCLHEKSPYFFIGFSGDQPSNYRMLDAGIIIRINNKLERIFDPELPAISYRKFRDYKSLYVINEHGAFAAKEILQHSTLTQEKNYIKNNEKHSVDKITTFHEAVSNFFTTKYITSIPSGGCDKEGSPVASDSDALSPNCSNTIGCLNCDNFKLHADPEDARKILSMEYVIHELIACCSDSNHFSSVYDKSLNKIKLILEEMQTINKDMTITISKIRTEIYDDNLLTEYWQRQLERLVKIGILK